MPHVTELTAAPLRVDKPALPRVAAHQRVVLGVLALTALSFLAPSAPTYDPWAWIVWGREIMHLDLSTTAGPSWKPLPVLLTTPFSLFGPLAPALWLFVARAGTLAGVVLMFRVARRLGGGAVGATAAATASALAPWTVRNAAMGNSEGLLVVLALAAVDRHRAGARRQAFAFAFGCALLRAAHRAHTPRADSAAFADNPVVEVLHDFFNMITPVAWAGLAVLVVLVA